MLCDCSGPRQQLEAEILCCASTQRSSAARACRPHLCWADRAAIHLAHRLYPQYLCAITIVQPEDRLAWFRSISNAGDGFGVSLHLALLDIVGSVHPRRGPWTAECPKDHKRMSCAPKICDRGEERHLADHHYCGAPTKDPSARLASLKLGIQSPIPSVFQSAIGVCGGPQIAIETSETFSSAIK